MLKTEVDQMFQQEKKEREQTEERLEALISEKVEQIQGQIQCEIDLRNQSIYQLEESLSNDVPQL